MTAPDESEPKRKQHQIETHRIAFGTHAQPSNWTTISSVGHEVKSLAANWPAPRIVMNFVRAGNDTFIHPDGGDTMQVEVKCSVSNCEYWASGNNCVANSILVSVDKHADANLKEEFGMMGGEHQDSASNSADTCCHTFKQKATK